MSKKPTTLNARQRLRQRNEAVTAARIATDRHPPEEAKRMAASARRKEAVRNGVDVNTTT